jgi:hypothetical protein
MAMFDHLIMAVLLVGLYIGLTIAHRRVSGQRRFKAQDPNSVGMLANLGDQKPC